MKNNTLAGRVLVGSVAINITDTEGLDPEGAFRIAARDAVDRAAEEVGGLAYHPSDGDVYLDLQDGELMTSLDLAVGIIVVHLTSQGFPVIVIDMKPCPGCEHDLTRRDECPICGWEREVENRAF